MKKNFKYMLVALLAVFGFGAATAVISDQGDARFITYGHFNYEITKLNKTTLKGTVKMLSVADGVQDEDLLDANSKLEFPGHFEYKEGDKTYYFEVTEMQGEEYENDQLIATPVFFDRAHYAKSVVIPAELTAIPVATFNTCTHLESITFEQGSKVKSIAPKAFASTMISEFDFTPCTVLEELSDNVFIDIDDETNNTNTFITKVTLPTGPEFKHINAAFRHLPKLTEIVNLDKSYISELGPKAFDGDKELKVVSLPNTIKWIDGNALEGSAVESFTVDVKSLISLGGGEVVLDKDATTMRDKYMFVPYGTDPDGDGEAVATVDPKTNLYNLDDKSTTATPLKSLVLKGELGGKICSYAFAYCDGLQSEPAEGDNRLPFDLNLLTYGSQAQIQTSAFADCDGITTLTINDILDNQLGATNDAPLYTIEGGAFGDCANLATLFIGDVTTANAIGAGAFGKKLKNVTIGTVKAGTPVFEAGAFVWDNVDGTTLKLATGEGEYVSADSPNSGASIIAAGVFDFSAVKAPTTVFPVVEIGEVKSQGGVFAEGALKGTTIEALTFTGDININGLDHAILGNPTENETTFVYEQEPVVYVNGDPAEGQKALPTGAKIVEEPTYSLKDVGKFIDGGDGKYNLIDGLKARNEDAVGGVIPAANADGRAYIFESKDKVYEEVQGDVYDPSVENPVEPREGMYEKIGNNAYKHIEKIVERENANTNGLKTLTFKGKILTNGVGGGTFANLLKLETVVFEKELAENAVAAGSFEGSGKVGADGNIGTEEAPFVDYQFDGIEDYTVNPFNSNAFVAADYVFDEADDNAIERIIWWKVKDDNLRKSIANAIHKDVLDNDGDDETDYDGDDVDKKFNVYKWIDILGEEEEALANTFLVFRNQNEPNVAWGRYDLGSFEVEKGKYYEVDADGDGYDDNTGVKAYTKTPMKIARRQKIDGSDVNITLYGLYTEEDDIKKQSATYMVPLFSQDGYYYIRKQNKELIIVKVEKIDGDFTVEDLPVAYENTQKDEDALTWKEVDGEPINEIIADANGEKELVVNQGSITSLNDPMSSVWIQLLSGRDYTKSPITWTHQELINAVNKKVSDALSEDIESVDLWIMTDPAKYNGFRIDKNEVKQGNGAFIRYNWYYALLNKYKQDNAQEARVIWLDDAQATAIFSVNAYNGEANNGAIYNLQGIRVNGTQKGVYIQNGKKFIVK